MRQFNEPAKVRIVGREEAREGTQRRIESLHGVYDFFELLQIAAAGAPATGSSVSSCASLCLLATIPPERI